MCVCVCICAANIVVYMCVCLCIAVCVWRLKFLLLRCLCASAYVQFHVFVYASFRERSNNVFTAFWLAVRKSSLRFSFARMYTRQTLPLLLLLLSFVACCLLPFCRFAALSLLIDLDACVLIFCLSRDQRHGNAFDTSARTVTNISICVLVSIYLYKQMCGVYIEC